MSATTESTEANSGRAIRPYGIEFENLGVTEKSVLMALYVHGEMRTPELVAYINDRRERSVNTLYTPTKALEDDGLIVRHREGQGKVCEITKTGVRVIEDHLEYLGQTPPTIHDEADATSSEYLGGRR